MAGMGRITGYSIAAGSNVFLARIENTAGQLITQSTVSSIAYASWDVTNAALVVTGTLTVATVVFNTAQDDDLWEDVNDTNSQPGYNFRWVTPTTLLPKGNTRYIVTVQFTMTNGSVIVQNFDTLTYQNYQANQAGP